MQFDEGISFHTSQVPVTAGQTFTGYERMRIDNAGNVGIGTISAASRLQIADGPSGEQLRLTRGTGVVRFAQSLNKDNLYLYNSTASQLYMYWNDNGNVGIGTSNPTHKLTVNGSINATELYVNGSPVAVPAKVIVMWSGSVDAIPEGWALCNGNDGTPDLRDRFIISAGTAFTAGTAGTVGVQMPTTSAPRYYALAYIMKKP